MEENKSNQQPKELSNIAEQESQEDKQDSLGSEFIKVEDNRTGLKIMLGSSSFNVSQLANLTLWIKSNWNNQQDKTTGGGSYLG